MGGDGGCGGRGWGRRGSAGKLKKLSAACCVDDCSCSLLFAFDRGLRVDVFTACVAADDDEGVDDQRGLLRRCCMEAAERSSTASPWRPATDERQRCTVRPIALRTAEQCRRLSGPCQWTVGRARICWRIDRRGAPALPTMRCLHCLVHLPLAIVHSW